MTQKNYKNNPKYRKEVRKWKRRKADELRSEGDILAACEGDTQDHYLVRKDDTKYHIKVEYNHTTSYEIWVLEYLAVQKVDDKAEYCNYSQNRISMSDHYDRDKVMNVIEDSSIDILNKGMNRHADIYLRTVRRKIKVYTQLRRHKLEPPSSLKMSGAL